MWRSFAAGLVDVASLLGLFVVVTGGYWHRGHGHGPELDLTSYGPWFWPLVVCLVLGYRPGGYVLPAIDRVCAWFEALPSRTQGWYLVASIGVLTAANSCAVYARDLSFQAGMDWRSTPTPAATVCFQR